MDASVVDRPAGTEAWLFMAFTDPVLVQVEAGAPPVPCAAGTVLLWRPRQPHWFGNPRAPWSHSWIHCSGSFVADKVAASRLPVGRPISGIDPSLLERCVEEVLVEIRDHSAPDRILIGNALHGFLRRLARAAHAGESVPRRWLEVRRQLDEQYRSPVSLADLAADAGCTVTHLCDAFVRHFGVPPYRYLLSLRLNHARALLLDRSLSVAEVAEAVGYRDVRQFTRLFRKRYGLPPSRLRAPP